MKKFVTMKDFKAEGLTTEVAESVKETLDILDVAYGQDRTEANLGGYVLVVENKEDLDALTYIFNDLIENVIPEMADAVSGGYYKATYLLNPDFAVAVVFGEDTVPDKVAHYIEVAKTCYNLLTVPA